ncbi:toxin-antitoxin system YwqK family antitoxin [Owenweeksia hongkongensis]|uniref:toxin-antitoxin system YwqK family antitoxin n=1 Tax=Owenweeksia hongkongensis TaxID=253245 RepID=UPI003A943211
MRTLSIILSLSFFCFGCTETPDTSKNATDTTNSKEKDILGKHTVKTTHQTDNTSSEIPYENGLKNGLAKQHYPNGKIWKESPYKDGKLEGIVKVYDRNGKLLRTAEYHKGKLDGSYIKYFKSGKPKYTAKYSGGLILPGIIEKNYRNEMIKQPEITYSFEDRLATDNEYYAHFKLSGKANDVNFFALRDATEWNPHTELSVYRLPTENNDQATMTFKIDPGYFIATDVHIYVTYKTSDGNEAVVYKQVNVAAENISY